MRSVIWASRESLRLLFIEICWLWFFSTFRITSRACVRRSRIFSTTIFAKWIYLRQPNLFVFTTLKTHRAPWKLYNFSREFSLMRRLKTRQHPKQASAFRAISLFLSIRWETTSFNRVTSFSCYLLWFKKVFFISANWFVSLNTLGIEEILFSIMALSLNKLAISLTLHFVQRSPMACIAGVPRLPESCNLWISCAISSSGSVWFSSLSTLWPSNWSLSAYVDANHAASWASAIVIILDNS